MERLHGDRKLGGDRGGRRRGAATPTPGLYRMSAVSTSDGDLTKEGVALSGFVGDKPACSVVWA